MSNDGIHLGIDASNIINGGGVTHLSQLLSAANPIAFNINKVTIWASKKTLIMLPTYPWLVKRSTTWVNLSLPFRLFWQQFKFPKELIQNGCDVLFSPGGTLPINCKLPMVTMSQNMLPFEPSEVAKFGMLSFMRSKMRLLRIMQSRSFRCADGLIFLTNYARKEIMLALSDIRCSIAHVPHGVEQRFMQYPKLQRKLSDCTKSDPFKFLYVSIIMPYKHQKEIAIAVAKLRTAGMPVEMRFIGSSWGRYGVEFRDLLNRLDPNEDFLKWSGPVPFKQLHNHYRESDVFVFGSSCENLPNILIEAMASGLAIACSDRGPMPEILGAAGVYFNPESPDSVAQALMSMINDLELRQILSYKAWEKSKQYSWESCADETFKFISKIYMKKRFA